MKKGQRGFTVSAELATRYVEGESAASLAVECDVTSLTFLKALRRQGVPVRMPGRVAGRGRWRTPNLSIREGTRFKTVCPRCGTKRLLARNPCGNRDAVCPPCRKKETGGRKDRVILTQEDIDRYLTNTSASDLARSLGHGTETIIKALKRQGVRTRPLREAMHLVSPEVFSQSSAKAHAVLRQRAAEGKYRRPLPTDLVERYRNGESLAALGREYTWSPSALGRRLRQEGIEVRTLAEAMKQVSRQVLAQEESIFQSIMETDPLLIADPDPSSDTKNGKVPVCYHTGQWTAWRKAILVRDGSQCALCGWGSPNGQGLAAHHILPKVRYPKLIYSVRNGITLCSACHLVVNSHEAEFQQQFLAHTLATT